VPGDRGGGAGPAAHGWRQDLRAVGPGLVTGASDSDPSGVATYSQAGAAVPAPEPSAWNEIRWLQPYPDTLLDAVPDSAPGPDVGCERPEASELAFIAALQRIPPRPTATLGLRNVLGYSDEEVADMLNTSPTAVKGTLQRARASGRIVAGSRGRGRHAGRHRAEVAGPSPAESASRRPGMSRVEGMT
jgi:hypothetical protein